MTSPTTTLRSHAVVPTERAERWVTQLASHLGHKAEVVRTDTSATLAIAGGSCVMTWDAAAARFAATAPEAEALGRIEDVVGRHLERFAAKEGLTVDWQRD